MGNSVHCGPSHNFKDGTPFQSAVKKWNKFHHFLASSDVAITSGPLSTGGDIQPDWRWVEILEIVQRRTILRPEFKCDLLPGGTAERSDGVAVPRRDGDDAEVLGDAGRVGVGRHNCGRGGQLGKVNCPAAGEGEAGGHELRLFREEEDKAAFFAGVAGGDIEVKD